MTMTPDTVEPAAPADPAVYGRRPRTGGLPLSVWALILFGLVCVLAGIAVANYGPRLWPAPHPAQAPSVAPAAATADAAPSPPGFVAAAPPPGDLASTDLAGIEARVAALETDQGDIAAAAAAAVAAAIEARGGRWGRIGAGLCALAPLATVAATIDPSRFGPVVSLGVAAGWIACLVDAARRVTAPAA